VLKTEYWILDTEYWILERAASAARVLENRQEKERTLFLLTSRKGEDPFLLFS